MKKNLTLVLSIFSFIIFALCVLPLTASAQNVFEGNGTLNTFGVWGTINVAYPSGYAGAIQQVPAGDALTAIGYSSSDSYCQIGILTAPVTAGGGVDFSQVDRTWTTAGCSSGPANLAGQKAEPQANNDTSPDYTSPNPYGPTGPSNGHGYISETSISTSPFVTPTPYVVTGWTFSASSGGGFGLPVACFYQSYMNMSTGQTYGWGQLDPDRQSYTGTCATAGYTPNQLQALVTAPAGRVIVGILFDTSHNAFSGQASLDMLSINQRLVQTAAVSVDQTTVNLTPTDNIVPVNVTNTSSTGGVVASVSASSDISGLPQNVYISATPSPGEIIANSSAPLTISVDSSGTVIPGTYYATVDVSGTPEPGTIITSQPPPINVIYTVGTDGQCATPPNGASIYTSPPTGTLCTTGTASPSSLSGSAPWNWTCSGSGGGADASCSAGSPTVPPIHYPPPTYRASGVPAILIKCNGTAGSCNIGAGTTGTVSWAPIVTADANNGTYSSCSMTDTPASGNPVSLGSKTPSGSLLVTNNNTSVTTDTYTITCNGTGALSSDTTSSSVSVTKLASASCQLTANGSANNLSITAGPSSSVLWLAASSPTNLPFFWNVTGTTPAGPVNEQNVAGGTTNWSGSFTYATPGTYSVNFTVPDTASQKGCTSNTMTLTVNAANVPTNQNTPSGPLSCSASETDASNPSQGGASDFSVSASTPTPQDNYYWGVSSNCSILSEASGSLSITAECSGPGQAGVFTSDGSQSATCPMCVGDDCDVPTPPPESPFVYAATDASFGSGSYQCGDEEEPSDCGYICDASEPNPVMPSESICTSEAYECLETEDVPTYCSYPTLSGTWQNPLNGNTSPLDNVSLENASTAGLWGGSYYDSGIMVNFYCNSDESSPDESVQYYSGSTVNGDTAAINLCNYPSPGTYTARATMTDNDSGYNGEVLHSCGTSHLESCDGTVDITVPNPPAGTCGTANKLYPTGSASYGSDTYCSFGTPSATPAFPSSGNTATWSCDASGGNSQCAASIANSQFSESAYSVNVTTTTGGSVASTDGHISCGSTCSASYNQGSNVTLTPTPSSSYYQFDGWSGDCSGSGQCVLNVTRAENVTATFGPRGLNYQEF